jgi:hypothetical protein
MTSNFSAEERRQIVWRFCYWTALVAIFAWAVWQRFVLPLDPIADPDTWGYLSPALRKLIGAEFGHTHGRNFVYPAFLFLLLRGVGDFRAISIVQHLLGLMAGAILLLTWHRARVFLPNPRLGGRVHDALGLIAAALFLSAAESIHFEMQLRPEAVCAFVFSVNIWLVVRFAASCYIDNRPNFAAAYGVALVCSSVLLASLKPSLVLVGLLAVTPVAVFLFRRNLLRQKLVLGVGAVAGAVLLLLPERVLSRNDEQSRTFLPTTLFVVHATLIRDQMSDDLQRGAKLPYPRDWLARVHATLNNEIAKSATAGPRYHLSAGSSADYLMYYPSSIAAQLRAEFRDNVDALCAFYRFWYWRTWEHRPVSMLRKVAHQMSIFYSPVCTAYNTAKTTALTDEYARGVRSLDLPLYRETWARCAPGVAFVERSRALAQNAPPIEQPFYIRKPLGLFAAAYLPLLLSSVALGAFVFLRRNDRRRIGWLAALVLFLFGYNFVSCLEIAVIQVLEYRRYITVQMYFTLLAEFFALWFVLEFALQWALDRKRPR